jgi:PKD repeat protein
MSHSLTSVSVRCAPSQWKPWAAIFILFCIALAAPLQAQFTFHIQNVAGGSAHSTPDGGFVMPHRVGLQFAYAKFDSNAVFQYGYRLQGAYSASNGIQRFGKIFTMTASNNYYVDFAKIDMATGVMEAHKRIQGPTGGQTYFTAGPADVIATQDSGLLLALNPQQCYQIASCDICHLKLDKNLNYQFFTVGTFFSAMALPNPFVVENADGSFTHARNISLPGTRIFLARYSGTTGALLSTRLVHSPGPYPYIIFGLSSDGNEVLLSGNNTSTDSWVMSLPVNLASVNWWRSYLGAFSNTGFQRFTKRPGNAWYGRLGNYVMSLTPTGQVRWSKIADGGAPIGPNVRVGATRMLGAYNTLRAALIDSLGMGLCTPLDQVVLDSIITPQHPTTTFSHYVSPSVSITPLPLLSSVPYTPQISIQCSTACTFTAAFSYSANLLSVNFFTQTPGITSHYWTFGDGGTSTGAYPTHTYSAPGTYTVCYIGTTGCMADTVCQQVTVVCNPTVSSFTDSIYQDTIAFTNTSMGSGNITYSWDFGDGSTSTVASPVHVYPGPGYYTVCLIASGPCGNDTTCQLLNVGCGTTTAAFIHVDSLLSVQFTSTSTAQGNTTYHWDFGDGDTSTAANPSHVYAASGNYLVCLIVTSPCGSDTVCEALDVICDAPTAAFSHSAQFRDVQFSSTVTGSGSITLQWTFGDGDTSSLPDPLHTYAQPGVYQVCLVATGPCGIDTLCDSVTVVCPPLAAAIGSVGNFPVMQFSDLSFGSPFSWAWDFGDGNTSTLQNPSHTYGSPGTYLVCLTVVDSCSEDSSCTAVDVLVAISDGMAAAFDIYPNPADHTLQIHTLSSPLKPVEVEIFSADGRRRWQAEVAESLWRVDVTHWPAGMYWVRLRAADAVRVKQVSVVH